MGVSEREREMKRFTFLPWLGNRAAAMREGGRSRGERKDLGIDVLGTEMESRDAWPNAHPQVSLVRSFPR